MRDLQPAAVGQVGAVGVEEIMQHRDTLCRSAGDVCTLAYIASLCSASNIQAAVNGVFVPGDPKRRTAPFQVSKARKAKARKPRFTTVVVLRLYVAGRAPNSVQAIANLEAICREHLKGHKLEVVDVLEHPLRAMADGVLVTPSLSKLSPLPAASVVGNLSDRARVLLALGVKAGDRGVKA